MLSFLSDVNGLFDLSGKTLWLSVNHRHLRCTFTRSHRASSLTEHNKSALTDHATQENHVINWSQATEIDREPERFYQMDHRGHTHPKEKTT